MQDNNIDVRAIECKKDSMLLEEFIIQFKPFILSTARDYLKISFIDDTYDEVSISMSAFAEAINSYDPNKGHFIGFAREVINRRLIDYTRKESRYNNVIVKIPAYEDEEDEDSNERLFESASIDEHERREQQQSLKYEIEDLTEELKAWDLTFNDVYLSCSKQKNTREFSNTLLDCILKDEEITNSTIQKKYLPIAQIEKKYNIPRKKIEKLRNFIVMSVIIHKGDYPMIQNFLNRGR